MVVERREESIAPDRTTLILQPQGVEIRITGPKEDLRVIFESPDGEFSFNNIPPVETQFEFHDLPWQGFAYGSTPGGEPFIQIPPTKKMQEREPAFAILHEKGHAASHQDPEWREKLEEAYGELNYQFFFTAFGKPMWVSDDPGKREQERQALAILCQEERRASTFALWQVRQLRKQGIDPIPHRKSFKELKKMVEIVLKESAFPEFGISIIRERKSLYQRFVNKLLGTPPRGSNAAVRITRWEDVRKGGKLRF